MKQIIKTLLCNKAIQRYFILAIHSIIVINCGKIDDIPIKASNAKFTKEKENTQKAVHLPSFAEITKHRKVTVLAPSTAPPKDFLDTIKSFGLNFHIKEDMVLPKDKKTRFEYLGLSNTAEYRAKSLIEAINDPKINTIMCAKGGYGASDLIPYLEKLPIPKEEKYFVGYSDATILNLFFAEKWGWHPIHGPMLFEVLDETKDEANFVELKNLILIGARPTITGLRPLNSLAKKSNNIIGEGITGGNLTMLQTALGYPYKLLNTKNKIVVMEDVNEQPYKIKRVLTQLKQTGALSEAKAIVFGKFTSKDSNMAADVAKVLSDLAETLLVGIPVYQTDSIGHDKGKNIPWQYNKQYVIKGLGTDDFVLEPIPVFIK